MESADGLNSPKEKDNNKQTGKNLRNSFKAPTLGIDA